MRAEGFIHVHVDARLHLILDLHVSSGYLLFVYNVHVGRIFSRMQFILQIVAVRSFCRQAKQYKLVLVM